MLMFAASTKSSRVSGLIQRLAALLPRARIAWGPWVAWGVTGRRSWSLEGRSGTTRRAHDENG